MSKSDAAVQSSVESTSLNNRCGASSSNGSSPEPGSTGVGSRANSQTGSGNDTVSGSGSCSAKGSPGSASGNGSFSGGSKPGSGNGSGNGSADDGYCGDGSTGSGSDNASDGNDDPNDDNGKQPTPKSRPSARAMLQPSLVDGGSHSLGGMPMKVEVGGILSRDHRPKSKSALHDMPVMLDNITQQQQQAPRTTPSASTSNSGLQAGTSMPDSGPLGELLEKILLQVAQGSSGEETQTVCTALASSLATVIMQGSMAKARTEEMDQNSQILQIVQKEIERQRLVQSQFAQNQAPWQQRPDLHMTSLLQRELESQLMNSPVPSGIGSPSMAPPLGFPHLPGQDMRTQSPPWGNPSSSPPPVASPLASQLQEEWRMRRLLQQGLGKGWTQPETEAAHEAAAAWQQEQAFQMQMSYGIQAPRQPSSLPGGVAGTPESSYAALKMLHDWGFPMPQQPSSLPGHANGSPEALYAASLRASPMPPLPPAGSFELPNGSLLAGARRPAGLGMTPPAQEMFGPSPLLQPQMSDPSTQLPQHIPRSLAQQMLSGNNFKPAPGLPMSASLPSQFAPKASPADSGSKGQRKGSGKGNAAVSKKSRNGVQGMPGNAPVSNGSRGHAATPAASQAGTDMSLRANLETLRSMDCNSIIQVRKINQLGFESVEVLEEHFSKYGKVDRVLVSHCYAKARNLRFRPSGLGFVVMSEPAEVQKILAEGPEMQICREVDGVVSEVTIQLQAFKPQRALESDMGEGEQ